MTHNQTSKSGGTCPPVHPVIDTHVHNAKLTVTDKRITGLQKLLNNYSNDVNDTLNDRFVYATWLPNSIKLQWSVVSTALRDAFWDSAQSGCCMAPRSGTFSLSPRRQITSYRNYTVYRTSCMYLLSIVYLHFRKALQHDLSVVDFPSPNPPDSTSQQDSYDLLSGW